MLDLQSSLWFDGNTQVLIILHRLHILSQNAQRLSSRPPLLPKIDHHLSGLTDFQLQVILPSPLHQVVHQCPVLPLLSLTYTPNSQVVRKLLQVTRPHPVSLTTTSDRTLPIQTNCGLPVTWLVIQETMEVSTPITRKECDSHSTATTIQVQRGSLQQVDDSVINSQVGLVSKLQRV